MGFFAAIQAYIFAAIHAFPTWKPMFLRCGFTLALEENRRRKVDQIFKMVDENRTFECLEPPSCVIKTELLQHQREGLGWLVQRENSDELPPFWGMRDGKYVNALTDFETDTKPESLRGGILADDIGLGKTLTLLSLVAYDKDQNEIGKINDNNNNNNNNDDDDDEGLSTNKRKKERTSEEGSSSQKRCRSVSDPIRGKQVSEVDNDMKTKATLIVCPASVLSTWMEQLEEHSIRGSLKTYLYYGQHRTKDAQELKKHDIVLTTYATLSSEESLLDTPVKKLEWWRIILDDAHTIKNIFAQQSRAVIKLTANRRWAVTGTPIQNSPCDLFSVMAFLRIQPFSINNCWRFVRKPLSHAEGLSYLQVLMSTISLRRTKDKGLVGLPSKIIETHYVELSLEEHELYDQMKVESKKIMMGYINEDARFRQLSSILSMIERLHQISTDHLPLCPSDLKSVLPSANIEDVTNNPDLLELLIEVLQDDEDFECPICISTPMNIVITSCGHIFCRDCILTSLQCSNACCPICRHTLSESDLFSAPLKSSMVISTTKPRLSSKVSALIKLLIDSRGQVTKSVVFSQFREMLLLLEEPLKEAGFKTLRLEGKMNAKQKAQITEKFGGPGIDEPVILLASLKASNTNINLTAASRVYFMEPWWNPALEEHAMNLVHRVGQKDIVKVFKLVTQDSIEERVIILQEKKKELERETSENGSGDVGMDMDDVRFLLFG